MGELHLDTVYNIQTKQTPEYGKYLRKSPINPWKEE